MAKKPCIYQTFKMNSNHGLLLLFNVSSLYLLLFGEDDYICNCRMTDLVLQRINFLKSMPENGCSSMYLVDTSKN